MGQMSGDSAPLGTEGPKRRDFLSAWRRGTERFASSRGAILDARDLEDGTLVSASPDSTVGVDGTLTYDPFSSRLPQRIQLPLQLEQQIADLMPDILREPRSGSETADAQAQKTEAWTRGAIEQHLPWRDSVGKAVRDAEWGACLLPASGVWDRLPTWMDTQSKAIRDEWWRDAAGTSTRDASKISRKQSAKAYREAWERQAAKRLPAVYRIISATDCVPFFTRGWGKRRWEVSSLLIRTLYTVDELMADGYAVDIDGGMERMRALLPTGYSADNMTGQSGLPYLYEWLYYAVVATPYGWDRIPMVSYSIGGLPTFNTRMMPEQDDAPADATINLRERYGMQRHLMGYYWGFQRSGEDNPDRKGIPYLEAWKDTIIGVEELRAATRKHAKETAYRGYQFIPDPNVPAEAYLLGTDGARTMRQFPLPGSGESVSVPGEYKPVAPAPMGESARYMIETDLAILQASTPSPQQAGYGDERPGSGRELSVSHALFQTANSHAKEGLRQAVEDLGEWELEIADSLMAHFKLDGIPVSSNQPVTAQAAAGKRAPRETLTLTRGMLNGDYELTAFYPEVGNIAEVAQEIADAQAGYSTFERVAEKKGVNDPFSLRVQILRDRYLDSPEGQMLQNIWLARYRGDEDAAQQLIEQLKMAQDGTPAAEISPEAMTAAEQAVGQQMALPAGGMPAPGDQARGGIINGGLQTGNEMTDAAMTSDIIQAPQARIGGL